MYLYVSIHLPCSIVYVYQCMESMFTFRGIRSIYQRDLSLCSRAAFVFDEGNNLGVSGKGQDFATFKSFFNPDNRGFGYIKVQVMGSFK